MTDDDHDSTDARRSVDAEPIRRRWTRSEPPSMAIVEAVAAALDCEPTALPPLGDRLEPEALDRLLERSADLGSDPVRLSFTYAGVEVTVDGGGTVEARPPTPEHE